MHKMSLPFMAVLGAAAFAGIASATPPAIVLNEYNGVKSNEHLGECDQYWGVINGNAGNWVELLVTSTRSLQGVVLHWDDDKDEDNNYDTTGGSQDYSGTITFTNAAIWSSVPAGTIITIREVAEGMCDNYCSGLEDENPSLDTANGDWWIGVYLSDDTYVTHQQPDPYLHSGDGRSFGFRTDNDDWRMQITESNGSTVIQDWSGEGASSYTGSNVSTAEVCKLRAITTSSSSSLTYSDGDSSSFGSFNYWSSGLSAQDLSSFRNGGSADTDVWDDNDYCGGDHTVCTPTCP